VSIERQVFSLKQVLLSIRKTIDKRYGQLYWVKGELHKLNISGSGHAFPELVQKEDDKVVAQINGTIWRTNLERINRTFAETVKEPLKEGVTLLMQVKIVYHEIYGLNLHINDIDPSFTLGELQKERENTLKQLQYEGILNANQQLPFPLLPKRIALISAENSKGLSDFMQVLESNPFAYGFFTMLFPAYLQGDVASASIRKQLKRIERVKHHFDLVAIVRGGGGEVGLSCYNNLELCRAIATFPLPVLTGIGHSTNITVAEMVAFRNAITPTELADFLLQCFDEFRIPLVDASKWMSRFCLYQFEREHLFLKNVHMHLRSCIQLSLEKNDRKFNTLLQHTRFQFKSVLYTRKEQLLQVEKALSMTLKSGKNHAHKELTALGDLFPKKVTRIVQEQKKELEALSSLIQALDPIHVLKRGYSIARANGKSISANTVLEEETNIQIETADWHLTTKLIKKRKNE
jgi:exodeoxyribonuclease VII large subunit